MDNDKNNNFKSFLVNFLKASDFNICDIELKEEEMIITPEMENMIQSAPIPDEAKLQMFQKEKLQILNCCSSIKLIMENLNYRKVLNLVVLFALWEWLLY